VIWGKVQFSSHGATGKVLESKGRNQDLPIGIGGCSLVVDHSGQYLAVYKDLLVNRVRTWLVGCGGFMWKNGGRDDRIFFF
jgi:hypothetical protein